MPRAATPLRAPRPDPVPTIRGIGTPGFPAHDELRLERAPRVPVFRVARGQQRSLTSPAAEYPQVRISAGQDLDRRPTFQAGHADSMPHAAPAR
jgi:hypothetical protein